MSNRVICIDNQSFNSGFTTPFRFLAPQIYAKFPPRATFLLNIFHINAKNASNDRRGPIDDPRLLMA
jgi:hypothetical protein